jgi:hypothetical protein
MKKLLFALGLCTALATAWLSLPAEAVVSSTSVGNVNYTILNTDVRLIPTAALTTNRTWTLPSAGGTAIGQGGANSLDIIDAQLNVGGANSCIVIAPASGETINNSSNSVTWCGTGGRVSLIPVTGSNWQMQIVSAGQTLGTTTNDNAGSGYVGEVITTNRTVANAKQITTNSSITLGSVSLTAGDWDCRGTAAHTMSPTTTVTQLSASLVSTDGVLGTQGTDGTTQVVPASAISTTGVDLKLGPARFSIASTTTIFIVDGATFATSQLWAFGSATCRRAR